MTLSECQLACDLCNSCHAWDPLWPIVILIVFVAGLSIGNWITNRDVYKGKGHG
jgi:hypothetical protein